MKKAAVIRTKVVVIILAILVLSMILFLIFKMNILEWLRNLPEYQYMNDTEIDYTQLPPNKLALFGCTEKIAIFGTKDVSSKLLWIRDRREIYMYIDDKPTKKIELYADIINKNYYKIMFIKGLDLWIGEVKNNNLVIRPGILENYNTLDETFKEKIFLSDLKKLNGAHLLGPRLLCKTPEEIAGTEIVRTILDQKVYLIRDAGAEREHRCIISKVENSKYQWLKNYSLKEGNLMYFENNAWGDVENGILTAEQIDFRDIKDNMVNAKNGIKIDLQITKEQAYFSSSSGLHFNYNGKSYYYPYKTAQDIDYAQDFINALGDVMLELKNFGTTTNPFYLLTENSVQIGLAEQGNPYAIDDKEILYSVAKNSNLIIRKFSESGDNYLYIDASLWGQIKQRAQIKQNLIDACAK